MWMEWGCAAPHKINQVRYPSRHERLSHCWFNVGPPSTTLAQHWTSNGSISLVCWDPTRCLLEKWAVTFVCLYTAVPFLHTDRTTCGVPGKVHCRPERRSSYVDLMLSQRRRRWDNIKTTWGIISLFIETRSTNHLLINVEVVLRV